MSNFRFISYLYEYKKEQKGKNTGFIRVRGLHDFIELNMQIKPAKGVYEVYLHYETLPEVKSILVGTIRAVNGECHGIFHNILPILRKEGISFSAIEALTIWQEDKICHGTGWTESRCLERLLSEQNEIRQHGEEMRKQKEEGEVDLEKEQTEEGKVHIEERKQNSIRHNGIMEMMEKLVDGKEELNFEEFKLAETKSEELELEKPNYEERKSEESNYEERKSEESNYEEIQFEGMKSEELNLEEAEWKEEGISERMEQKGSPGWPKPKNIEELMLQLESIPSFGNDSFLKCVKIVPKDIGLLNTEDWYLGKNSFLLHGYFVYQYLMLGYVKFQDGGHQAILGVPGVYNSKDKYLAELFGFTNFIQAKKAEKKTGTFGYWITNIHENIR